MVILTNKKGVTLMELLVALAIISVALVPIINTFLFTMRLGRGSNDFTKAVLAAKSVMALLTLPVTDYSALNNQGTEENPESSDDYPEIKWYSEIEEIEQADVHEKYKKITLNIIYPKAGEISGGRLKFITYRYSNLD